MSYLCSNEGFLTIEHDITATLVSEFLIKAQDFLWKQSPHKMINILDSATFWELILARRGSSACQVHSSNLDEVTRDIYFCQVAG
jgi:hypothetical protein